MLVKNDIKSQQNRIHLRLEERKRQKSTEPQLERKVSLQNISHKRELTTVVPSESDNAGGSPSSPPLDFEAEFEKIMEAHVEKKYEAVSDIKRRYIPQIEELEQ